MLKMRHIILIAVLICLAGCRNNDAGVKPSGWDRIAKVLSTVPSDALCVTYLENSRDASEMLDSTSAFLGLGIEKLRTGMAISECFNGATVHVLTLAPVKNREFEDSTSALWHTMDTARSRHMLAEFIPDAPSLEQGEGVLIVTASGPQLRVTARHIGEGRSILDAENFKVAAYAAQGAGRMVIMRNSGARRILGQDFLEGAFSIRNAADFLHDAAQWTTFVPEGNGQMSIIPTPYPNGICYTQMLASLKPGRSRLGDVIPAETDLAVTLSVSPEFRQAYETYLDAGVKLTSYRRELSELETATGKDPLKWEKEQDIREVALVISGQARAVFLRPGRKVADSECADNQYRGFVPALYGSAFRTGDDSTIACKDGWYVVGSSKDVETFIYGDEVDHAVKWPSKPCRFIIFNSGRFAAWDKNGIKTWNSNQ